MFHVTVVLAKNVLFLRFRNKPVMKFDTSQLCYPHSRSTDRSAQCYSFNFRFSPIHAAQGFSLLWSFVLPSVKSSVYFYSSDREPVAVKESTNHATEATEIQNDREAVHRQPQDAGEEIKSDIHTVVDGTVVSVLPGECIENLLK